MEPCGTQTSCTIFKRYRSEPLGLLAYARRLLHGGGESSSLLQNVFNTLEDVKSGAFSQVGGEKCSSIIKVQVKYGLYRSGTVIE